MSIYPTMLSQTEFKDHHDITYPFEERGLQFGDGIYEVIRVYNGACYLLDEHITRLFRSADAVKITLPFTKGELINLLHALLAKNDVQEDAKIYLQATRGSAPRNHVFPKDVPANVYAYVQPQKRNLELMENGVGTITQPDIRWEYCYIKSLNLLPNVLSKQTANEHGCYEAILHKDGLVTECSAANVYLVKNGQIYTYPATKRILHGCVRLRVEQFAKDLQIPFVEEAFTLDDIKTADELFLTSSTSEVMPIISVDSQKVNDGKPGAITRKLQQAYEIDANIKPGKLQHNL